MTRQKHNWKDWVVGESRQYEGKTVYELQSLCGNWRRRNRSQSKWKCRTVGTAVVMERCK